MSLIKGSTAKKASANKVTSGGVGDFKKAGAWLNQQIVRSDGSSFKIKRGVAIIEGEDAVLDALAKSERAYRTKCLAEGVDYVPRVIHIQGVVQLVDEAPEVPDLFEPVV